MINLKKNLTHDLIKTETTNYLNSLKRDITQIYDHDQNTRKLKNYIITFI